MEYREYWAGVAEIAQSILDDAEEFDNVDEAQERVREIVDGHEWIIYTHFNFDVLRLSPNDAYSADNFGIESIVKDGAVDWAALAFGALYADVMERVDWDEVEAAIAAREDAS